MQPRMTIKTLATAAMAALAVAGFAAGPVAASTAKAGKSAGRAAAATPGQVHGNASVRNFAFIDGEAIGWRSYAARPAPLFKSGETLQFYAEPVDLGWSLAGKTFRFEVAVDIEIKSADGLVIWSQKDFGRLARQSPAADPQTFITGAIAVEGLPPGLYILSVRLREPSGRSAETQAAFGILQEPRRIDA